tara:strand:- start:334 stop:447 length:114 start_codon:yes stop_codon:yes gene_type:complete
MAAGNIKFFKIRVVSTFVGLGSEMLMGVWRRLEIGQK